MPLIAKKYEIGEPIAKKCSNLMKHIHFGYVDVQNFGDEIVDATGAKG